MNFLRFYGGERECRVFKALLHCAISSANLSRGAPRSEKREVCACAFVKTAVKLREKLLEG